MDAGPLGVVSGEQGKEEALTVEPALVPEHRCSPQEKAVNSRRYEVLAVKDDERGAPSTSCLLIKTD